MRCNLELWGRLSVAEQEIAALAALIPPPLALDYWAKAAALPSVKILQLAERLVREKVMRVYEPLGVGHYYFSNPQSVADIAEWTGPEKLAALVRQLLPVITSEHPQGIGRWMAIAYLHQISRVRPSYRSSIIRAAKHCQTLNLRDEAAGYYQLVIAAAMPETERDTESITAYIDAAIGLCLCKGRSIPLQEQRQLLTTALALSKEVNDLNNSTLLLVLLGQVNKSLGRYNEAARLFEQGWDNAQRYGSAELVKQVTLATIDFLMWQGRMAEAIERYENVLGNLEELPTDESALQACVQLGWIYGKCGQTVRGLGLINAVSDKATELGLEHIQIYAKVTAVNTLHDARRNAEAEPLIEEVLTTPPEKLDPRVLWPIYAARAYTLCYRGDYAGAAKMQDLAYANAKILGHFHHRGPINFEYMDVLEDAGHIHPEMNYDSEVRRVIDWPDIYMQGVGYYFRAQRTVKRKGLLDQARRDLLKSSELLEQSGAKLDLAFTQILLARILIRNGEREQAADLLKAAWNVFRFTNEKLFPQEFLHIVQNNSPEELLLDPLIEIGETIGTIRNRQTLLSHIITLALKLTGAERGAFFIKGEPVGIEIIASRNIEPDLVHTEQFESIRAIIDATLQSGETAVWPHPSDHGDTHVFKSGAGWQVVYPVTLQGKVLGVFFLERYLSGWEPSGRMLSLLKAISTQVAIALDNVRAYEEIAELKERLEAETLFYRSEQASRLVTSQIVGTSAKIKAVLSEIDNVSRSDTTVLIIGETGVGKELVAKVIHHASDRSSGPFIPVSIASLDDHLIASELFGHEKGAFTHALCMRRGRFELAHNGTLFLDEVNSLSLDVQAKLLRVLEEKAFERVGGSAVVKPDFRLIAASNQPLDQTVRAGTFRSDLYYRLNVYPIVVPPLRTRKEDIPLLVPHFVDQFNKKHGKAFQKINKIFMQHLLEYDWPGNVRELRHIVERAVISCKEKQLNFPEFYQSKPGVETDTSVLPFKEMQKQHIIKALALCDGKISGENGAAGILKLNPQTLYSTIKRLGIRKQDYAQSSPS